MVLVVNTASNCGFTPQFESLEAPHHKYQSRGLVVLGFPSNDFGGQDPGAAKEIQEFCKNTYAVDFPMFEKTNAAERNADPLSQALGQLAGDFPQRNFHKYLIGRDGKLIASLRSSEDPKAQQ